MNYLVVNEDCKLCLEKPLQLKANVPYQITDLQDKFVCCLGENESIIYTNFYAAFAGFATKNNVFAHAGAECDFAVGGYQNQIVQSGADKYLFMFFAGRAKQDLRFFKFEDKQVLVLLGENLIVNVDGTQLVNENVCDINFSHFEIEDEFCCIFFEGRKNYLVVLNKSGLVWADYYDEYNAAKGEKQILKRLCDGLNHGRVLSLKDKKFETYLVYLDDYELHLKPKFVALIFMDCLLAGNYKYCSALVSETLKFDEDGLKQFFPKIDAYYPLSATCVVMFKKNALVGICDFEIVEDKIVNITIN